MADNRLMDAATQIVSAFIARNPVPPEDLPQLINNVTAALLRVSELVMLYEAAQDDTLVRSRDSVLSRQRPAVSIEDSVTADHLICLEDGKRLKMLKRHLRAVYDMTPDEYRRKWGLPEDYPMVAPNYAKVRSQLARVGGFGTAIQPRVARPG